MPGKMLQSVSLYFYNDKTKWLLNTKLDTDVSMNAFK